MKKKPWVWLWLSLVIIGLDQLSKFLVVSHVSYEERIVVFPFLNIILGYNTGAAFNFLDSFGKASIYLLGATSIIVAIILIIWLSRLTRDDRFKAGAICLIIGGALGNCIDRLRLNHVIDFIDFHIHGWHFATFNVADSAICIGAFMLILQTLLTRPSA